MPEDLINKHLKALRELTYAGYAVVIFTPDEIGDDVDPIDLEHYLVGAGQNYIGMNTHG